MNNSPLHFTPFKPEDAEQVTALFYEVYGDAYPLKRVYHPRQLAEAVQDSQYLPFVARTDAGQVVAYGALCRSAPYDGIFELVQGIVSPDFRGGGIGRAMFAYVEQSLQNLPGAETYFGESVCNHLHTQKAGALIKSIETGLEVDLMPGCIYAKDTPDTGRIAVLDMFRSFVKRPHQVYLPERYETIIRLIYDGFDDHRTFTASTAAIPADQRTVISTKRFEEIAVARLAVTSIGPDFAQVLADLEQSLAQERIRVIQLWLKSTWPWLAAAVELVRASGFFFGGVFPRWFDDDALMLQKITGRPHWEGIKLYSERAQAIYSAVQADWRSTQTLP